MKIKYFLIAILFFTNSNLKAQNNFSQKEFYKYFDKIVSYSNTKSDCQIFQTQIKNSFLLTMNKNIDWLKNKIQSKVEFNEFMTDFFDYFIEQYPKLSLKLSNCTTFPKDVGSNFLLKNDIYKNGFTIDVIRTFLIKNQSYFGSLNLYRK